MAIRIAPQRSPMVSQLAQSLLSRPATPVYSTAGAISNLGTPIAGALLARAGEAAQKRETEAETTALGRMLKEAADAQSRGQDPMQAAMSMAAVQEGPGWSGAKARFNEMAQQQLAQSLMPQKPLVLSQGQVAVNPRTQQIIARGTPKPPKAPKTVNTAEGVFVLNPDGTRGARLGGPSSLVTINQPPSGFERGPGGTMQPVRGGPADPRTIAATEEAKKTAAANVKRRQTFPKVRASMRSLNAKWDRLDRALAQAESQISPWTVGVASNLAGVQGTPQYNLARTLDTARANIGFDELQKMRADSPTGGALGQVSEMENRLLQAVRGSLDQGQSEEQLRSTIRQIREDLAAVRQEKMQAFREDYSDLLPQQPRTQEVETQTTGADVTGETAGGIKFRILP